jgi:hypothetical protein
VTKSTLRLHTRQEFTRRVLGFLALGAGFLVVSLGVGVLGYRFIAGLSWIDALFNAAMILTGMGPADPMPDDAAKLFASAYAIFGGAAYPAVTAIVLYPLLQRMLVALHLQAQRGENEE